jgi:hypothetical protein
MFELRLRRCGQNFSLPKADRLVHGIGGSSRDICAPGPGRTSVAPDIIYELITSGPARSAIV